MVGGELLFRTGRLFICPIALRKTKIAYNFGLSECNRVNVMPCFCTPAATSSEKMCGIKYTVDGLTNISGLSFLAVISIKKIP